MGAGSLAARFLMRAGSILARRPVRIYTAALLLGTSFVSARAADTDNFFRDLDKAEGVASATELDATPMLPAALSDAVPSSKHDVATRPSTPVVEAIVPPPADPASVDALLEKSLRWDAGPDAIAITKRLIPKDWLPEHATGAGATNAPTPAGVEGKSVDPEPDAAIAPPIGRPSKDPLDRSAPPVAPTAAPEASPKVEPLSPLQAALKRSLDRLVARDTRGQGAERRKEHEAIAFFYAAQGFSPIWSKDGRPVEAVDSVLNRLAHAGDDALTVASVPKSLKAQGSSDDIVDSELALTEAVVSYARQASGSRVDPRNISALIGHRPELADPAEVLETVIAAGPSAGDKLEALNPTEARYVALRDKLISMRTARLPEGSMPIAAGPILHVGMHDRRVPLLRARFHLGPVSGRSPDESKYDADVAQAVAAYQRSNDLPTTGALTAATILALSGGHPSRIEGALATNMEMWRWMPHELGGDRIEVNVPDYIVTVFHDGLPMVRNRVVVGKIDTPTPLFSNTMKYLIVNPYWNVPQSIIKKEMLPKAGGDLSYLNGRGYSADWRGGQWVVKQLPGPKNALGRIKFLFPNDYSVYLHDTPSKSLFSAAKRAFSHGCVRVDQPFAFGEAVLNVALPDAGRKHWSEERLEGLVGDKERYINLPVSLPIHIEYFTASIEADSGRVKLRDDIYGYAGAVAAALGQANPTPQVDREPRLVAEHVRRRTPETTIDDAYDPR